ncbi:MAG: hypothetical protein AMXMBFR56_76870 [Polyangiaceae bacterium]
MVSARALSAFHRRETNEKGAPSVRYQTGALLVAEAFDNLRVLAQFVMALGKKR